MVIRCGFDIDGVLADFVGTVAQTMRHAPEPLSAVQLARLAVPPPEWDWARPIAGEKNWDWFWREGCIEYRSFAKAKPIGRELHWLARLEGEKFLITSRPHLVRDQTYYWLAKHQVLVDGVIHVNSPEEKLEFLRDLKIDVFVDDHPDTVPDLKYRLALDAYMFSQPWNAHVEGVARIKSLRELL